MFLQELGRVAAPVIDALDYLKVDGRRRNAVQCVLAHEMYRDRSSYWAWTPDQWRGIVGASGASYVAEGAAPHFCARNILLAVAYLLCNYHHVHAFGRYGRVALACRIFVRIESIPN